MESMIDSGEEWMVPLLEFRDYLASTQDPSVKPAQREFKGRDGRVRIKGQRLLWRTYTLETSRELLRRLLETQAEVQEYDPDFCLINEEELREIRRLWLAERRDWTDSLPEIYAGVTGGAIDWAYNDLSMPGRLELELLERLAPEYDVPLELVQKLMDAEWQYYGMRRRGLIHKTIKRIFDEDWRSWEEIQAELARRQTQAQEGTATT